MVRKEDDEYIFDPIIPEEIYLKILIPKKFEDAINKLTYLTGYSIRELPYIGDMFFSFSASIIHRDNFILIYENLIRFIEQKLDEFLSKREEIGEGKGEVILGGAVPSIHYLLPLDSLITCIKRTLDFSMRFTIKVLLGKEFKYISIHRLAQCFVYRNQGLNNINGEFEKNFPEFRVKFLEEWDTWMRDINDIRDNILHFYVIKEGVFDLRRLRDRNHDASFIHLTAKELENPREFVDFIMNRFVKYFTYIIEYNIQQLESKFTSPK